MPKANATKIIGKKPPIGATLCDIQYAKGNRENNFLDMLYITWRDEHEEKHLEIIENPPMDIYFTKEECRNHSHVKTCETLLNLDKVTVHYKDIIYKIAQDMGETGKAKLSDILQSGQAYNRIKEMFFYPYVYGADFDIRDWYRIQWLQKMNTDKVVKLHKGFLDIEVDGIDVTGMPYPEKCPINAVTLIDAWNKTSYTFLLIEGRENDPQINHMINHIDEYKQELHEKFDDSYPDLEYELMFYKSEKLMLVHLFELINTLKLDFIGIWNMSFDIPYILERMVTLGLDPMDVIPHPDFPNKICRFKKDTYNFDIKNKSDFFYCTSYTQFYCQMELYASIRKSTSELRSFKLNDIAKAVLKDTKYDYNDVSSFKDLPYKDYKMFVTYNIKDVLLQYGIEQKSLDFDTLYTRAYYNGSSYDEVFKQTRTLRNLQYIYYLKQGLIPGSNINVYNKSAKQKKEEDGDEDKFEGAIVARPEFNSKMGMNLYGKPSNNIFQYVIDMDMSAFYPSTIIELNIDPMTLIFKCIVPKGQFDRGEKKLRSITYTLPDDDDGYDDADDLAKEVFDNFATRNYLSVGYKFLNMPLVTEMYEELRKELG